MTAKMGRWLTAGWGPTGLEMNCEDWGIEGKDDLAGWGTQLRPTFGASALRWPGGRSFSLFIGPATPVLSPSFYGCSLHMKGAVLQGAHPLRLGLPPPRGSSTHWMTEGILVLLSPKREGS